MVEITERDDDEMDEEPLQFAGDAPPPLGPSMGWVLLWGGRYANIYGDYVPKALRLWGYVMWDECRWSQLGAGDLIAKQWENAERLLGVIRGTFSWRPASAPEEC